MGYTHYWTLSRPMTPDEFAAVAGDIAKIVAAAGVPLASEYDETDPPQADAELIRWNGAGDDGHETFYLAPDSTGFSFCKTAAKPYDVAVTASLLALKDRLGDVVRVESDGEPEDWQAGHALASRALGRFVPSPVEGLG